MMIKIARNLLSQLRRYLALTVLVSITACSGVLSTAVTIIAEGGISGTGISFGSIIGFSSVIVNGTKLEVTNNTEIFVDELFATQADLKVGHVIRVDTDFENKIAKRIDYVETVRGPIVIVPTFNPDTFEGSFDLLGQAIVTQSNTILDGFSDLSLLSIGDVLDVSGVRNSNGAIIARYINLKLPPVTEYRVIGTVSDFTGASFKIGNLTIDFSTADTGELDGVSIDENIEVRIKGTSSSYDSGLSSIVASKITPNPLQVVATDNIQLELEGAINEFTSLTNFKVNGIAINASNAVFEQGSAADLQLNQLVEVEGTVSSGITNATKVKILATSKIRVESKVDSIDPPTSSITVQGVVFLIDEHTQMEDDSASNIAQFSLADLSPNDYVKIRAYELDNQYFLTRLERTGPETELKIQAFVDSGSVDIGAKTISLLGITISTDFDTEYEDVNDLPIIEADFFSMVLDGRLIKAKWSTFNSITDPVDELSFED